MFGNVKLGLRLAGIAILAVVILHYGIVVKNTIDQYANLKATVSTLQDAKADQDVAIEKLKKANADAQAKVEQMRSNLGDLQTTFGSSQAQLDQLLGTAKVDIQRGSDGHVSQASSGALDSAYNNVNRLLRETTGAGASRVGGPGGHSAGSPH